MLRLLYYYWKVCTLQESPENTPYSRFLLLLSGSLLAFVWVVQWQFSDVFFSTDLTKTVVAALTLILSSTLYTYVILLFRGVKTRWVQTLNCLFFTYLIIHIIACPLLLLDPYLSHTHLKNPLFLFIGVVYLFTSFGLFVWKFVVTAHIYKHSLGTSAIQSVLAASGLLAVSILTVSFWR